MRVGTVGNRLRARVIGLVGFDGLSALDLTGPLDALMAAQRGAADVKQPARYDIRVIALTGKTFVSDSRLVFKADETLMKASNVDTILIPGGMGIRRDEISRKIADWLATHATEFRRVVSISTGVYAVAQSGLLAGRKATTHWRFARDVARRFPKVCVDYTSSFTKDGPFYSCGAGTAAIELTLALIEEDYGARVALSVAREFGMRLRPIGNNQSAFDSSHFECEPKDRMAELPAWIGAHLNDDLSVNALAERTCLCPRHFSRLFKQIFHSTPANFVEVLRLNEARLRLVLPRNSVEQVAAAVGFASPDSFRRAFERRFRISPRTFRKLSAKAPRQDGIAIER